MKLKTTLIRMVFGCKNSIFIQPQRKTQVCVGDLADKDRLGLCRDCQDAQEIRNKAYNCEDKDNPGRVKLFIE